MTQLKVWRQTRAAMIAADALSILLVYVIADMLRCRLWTERPWPEYLPGYGSTVRIHMKVLTLLPIGWPMILHAVGWYDPRWRPWSWYVRKSAAAAAVVGLLMAALALLFERDLYPRSQIGFTVALLPATALALRVISVWVGQRFGARRPGRVLIVGTGREAVRLRRLLAATGIGRPQVVGHLRGPWETEPPRLTERLILGSLDQLGRILDERSIDEVLFSAPVEAWPTVLPFVAVCEEVGVAANLLAESVACHSLPEVVHLHGVPLLAYAPARHPPELLSVKRLIDLAVACTSIVLAAPIMLASAVAIRLSGPGPILFRQRRSGLNGREFWMFKFRTMDPDAEARQAEVAHLNERDGPAFKSKADPRITWVGQFLRRWSLDELPQLFNVLLGDMAIVGPRPPIPAEVAQYDRWQRRRLSMRPGLTCLWQIRGRHHVGFEEWMRLDLFYIDYWSLKLDFLIMCKTIATVLSGSGA